MCAIATRRGSPISTASNNPTAKPRGLHRPRGTFASGSGPRCWGRDREEGPFVRCMPFGGQRRSAPPSQRSRPSDCKLKRAGPWKRLPRRQTLLHELPCRAEHARRDLGPRPIFRIEVADGAAGDAPRRRNGGDDIQPLLAQAPCQVGRALPCGRILDGISNGNPGRGTDRQPDIGRRCGRLPCSILSIRRAVCGHDPNGQGNGGQVEQRADRG